jgi:hypothetical protein
MYTETIHSVAEGTVDLRNLLSLEDEMAAVESFLNENGIEGDNALFTGICGNKARIKKLLASGIAGRKIEATFAQSKKEILESPLVSKTNVFEYAVYAGQPAIVVYDATLLHALPSSGLEEESITGAYGPVEGKSLRDALLAVVHLRY